MSSQKHMLSDSLFIAAMLLLSQIQEQKDTPKKETFKNEGFSKKSIAALYFILDSVIFTEIRRCSDRSFGKQISNSLNRARDYILHEEIHGFWHGR